MNPRLARRLTRLYPRAWRGRYGDEFEALLEAGPSDLRTLANSVLSALHEHISPTLGGNMDPNPNPDPNSFSAMLRRPSAYLPLAMSLSALTMVLVCIAIGLIVHHPAVPNPAVREDEGSIAHIWQLLMTVQMPIVLFFAVKWLRRAPGQTLRVLGLQAGAWLASCAPIYFLHL
ncbi:MAG: hypothetical protein ABR910_00595 [Acidobacteriaceae bacterium]|jgi:hypothetical protein